MFSKSEASRIRSAFWTNFGRYIAPVPSANGYNINWINYRTGVKHIRFTMDFTSRNAEVWVEFTFTDTNKRAQVFDAFASLWKTTNNDEEWIFINDTVKDEKQMAAVRSSIENVNIFQQDTWPDAIAFLKKQMLMLDEFWVENKEMFEMMA